jgi:nucleoside phosphorylase
MKVDVAIITTHADEFKAVLKRFSPNEPLNGSSSKRTYAISQVKMRNGKNCVVALVSCSEKGSDTAHQVANDCIHDLDPSLLLVVGVASGVPNDEFTLGDVIISSRIHNFNVSDLQADGHSTFDNRGGIHPSVSNIIASLPIFASRLSDWNTAEAISLSYPVILPRILPNIENAWQQRIRSSLNWHFGKTENRSRARTFKEGSIASSNTQLSDPRPLIQWMQNASSILAVEMGSAGVYEAAHGIQKQYPVMSICGISDIVGVERDLQWVAYACETAASFVYAFVIAGIIGVDTSANTANEMQQESVLMTPSYTAPEKSLPLRRAGDPISVFISYSPKDETFLHELETHLATLTREGSIRLWHRRFITAGRELVSETDSHLSSAQLILLLVSSDFLASDYLYGRELTRALKREKEKSARIIPIIVRPCDWQQTPIAEFVTLPRKNNAISFWENKDDVWSTVAQEVRLVCEEMLSLDGNQPLPVTQSERVDTATEPTHSQISISPDPSSDPPSRIYYIGEVFVRTGLPDRTFVESQDFRYVKQELRPGGRSMIIEGPSGVGKTSAIRKAKAALGSSIPKIEYLSLQKPENRERLRTLAAWHDGTLIIDDFHWLDAQLYQQIAEYLKHLVDNDEDAPAKKLIIIGIPHCRQKLIDIRPDLATRLSPYVWKPASDKMILELIEKGEKALNISFASKAEIQQTAKGSLFIAQSLCYNLCIEAGIEMTQQYLTIINCDIKKGIDRIMDELENKFWEPLLRFVMLGGYNDTTCRDLLHELANTKDGSLSLTQLRIKKTEMEPGIKRFISEHWMEA